MTDPYPFRYKIEDPLFPEENPGEGLCWACPNCDFWASIEDNARAHRWKTGHEKSVLRPVGGTNSARIEYQELARCVLEPDVYGNDHTDKVNRWNTYGEGDKQSSYEEGPLQFFTNKWPAGTKVIVLSPVCQACNLERELCELRSNVQTEYGDACRFDWDAWEGHEFG